MPVRWFETNPNKFSKKCSVPGCKFEAKGFTEGKVIRAIRTHMRKVHRAQKS